MEARGFLAIVLSCFALTTMASPVSCPGVHTWHNISTAAGSWAGTLTVINQEGGFVDKDCRQIEHFEVSADKPFRYGMYFKPGSDFNFTYTVAVAKNASASLWPAKRPLCLYVVSAYSPGKPQLEKVALNDAVCDIEDDSHRGVNFIVN